LINGIKIGTKTYTIERPLEIVQVGGEFSGMAHYREEVIKIADKLSQHDKNQTFLHELLHCICNRFYIEELNKDEQSLDLLATGLY